MINRDTQGSVLYHFFTNPKQFFQKALAPGSVNGSVFTLTTAIVGAGLITMPIAHYRSGLIWTFVQMCICAYIGIYSNMLLIDTSIYTKKMSYMSVASHCLSGWGLKLL